MIEKVVIKNYKSIEYLDLKLDDEMNILVGNNEQGKSTILEAVNLALTCTLNKRIIHNELTPFLFNKKVVEDYINNIAHGKQEVPPNILIELYLKENDQIMSWKGSNNFKKENTCGISLSIEFDDDYTEEYQQYIEQSTNIKNIPIEYYKVNWYSFASNPITPRSNPVKCVLIDPTEGKTWSGTDRYISSVIGDVLEPKQRATLNFNFRDIKERFSEIDSISQINSTLSEKTGEISDKELAISLDISQKNGWESNLTAYLNDIPFDFIGKGEQNSVKLKLSLESNADEAQVVLIEEPENHLSHSNMYKLINQITEKCKGKQLIITTHSTYVLNKLGLDKVVLMNNSNHMTLRDLNEDTYTYFKKLPGYDTLRLLLADKAILVEGPSDELIVQKAYFQEYNRLPIEDGIDVITVRGLSFKRFLEITDLLKKEVAVVTDNDGNVDKNIIKKYGDHYLNHPKIKICYSEDTRYATLEPQIVSVNELSVLNDIFGKNYTSKEELIKYMTSSGNKSECAMCIFDSKKQIVIPEYINEAIK
ncbi:ATP-dependent nuclease [Salsuginibacillus kocurii]|uniref:ATP-dependent nuclease n=1 Tax=Salsuginibacillus kocurii TaxID=427078 RepID=UPI000361AC72|nr:AAA family ATPase [Salsuginibacillus kocurii]